MLLVDYVAAHEAVHLAHKDHTRAYWAELARLVPDLECRQRARWVHYSSESPAPGDTGGLGAVGPQRRRI
jgi:predicted metal-dependent hydrolase